MRRLLSVAGLVVVLLSVSALNAAPTYAAPSSTTQHASSAATGISKPLAAPPSGACPYYHLCFWKDTYYHGASKEFYYCGFVDLEGLPWTLGWGDVDNDASSLVNNQTSGTTSVFWDVEGGRASLSQHSYGYRDNLVIDGWNDRITYILVC